MTGSPDPLDRFLLAACGQTAHGGAEGARALLAQHPEWAAGSPFVAAVAGDAASLGSILEADPSAANAKGGSAGWEPLLYACYSRFGADPHGIAECGRLLLDVGADANTAFVRDPCEPRARMTALLGAAGAAGNAALTGHLLAAGADPNDGAAVFHAAAERHFDCLELLVRQGGDLDRTRELDGNAPLHWLLDERYQRQAVEWLLDHGADVNLRAGEIEETPLHVATRRRRLDAVKLLIDRGADIDARTAGGKTAYAHAVRRPFDEVSDLLAERGADTSLNAADRLAVALVHERIEEARQLIAADPGLVPGMNPEEARILPDVASQGRREAVELLLDAGADIAARGVDGGTALHVAAWFCQPDMIELLLQRSAPLDIQGDIHESTPLGWAAHGSRFAGDKNSGPAYARIAELLLEAGASISADPEGDPHGRRFLCDAVEPVAEVLRRHGARSGE